METSCMWVAGADWFEQAAVLGTLILGFGMLASSRGRQLVMQLINDEEATDPHDSVAST